MGHEIISAGHASALIALTIALSLPASSPAAAQITAAATPRTATNNSGPKSGWSALTPAQQQALAPLAADWDKLDSAHKTKLLAIGNKFPAMKPEERTRIQNRMREWVKLSPQQRHIARENYWLAKKINPSQKSAHWQEYQQLPDEQKKSLAAAGAGKKRVVGLSKARKNNDVLQVKPKPKQVPPQPPQPGLTPGKDSSVLSPPCNPIQSKTPC